MTAAPPWADPTTQRQAADMRALQTLCGLTAPGSTQRSRAALARALARGWTVEQVATAITRSSLTGAYNPEAVLAARVETCATTDPPRPRPAAATHPYRPGDEVCEQCGLPVGNARHRTKET